MNSSEMVNSSETVDSSETLDSRERSQAEQNRRDHSRRTRRRREARAGRRRWMVLGTIGILLVAVLLAPTVASRIGIGQSFLQSELGKAGWTVDCDSLSIGWVTPLSVDHLSAVGPSGKTTISVAQIDLDITVLDALKGNVTSDLGTLSLRGVDVTTTVVTGSTSIEDDIAYWMREPASDDPFSAVIEVSDFSATIIDEPTKQSWSASGGAGSIALIGDPTGDQPAVSGMLEAVLSDPAKVGGGMRASFAIGGADQNSESIEFDFETDSLPLSMIELARTRMPKYRESIPQRIGGDATGRVKVIGGTDWMISAEGLQLREFNAVFPSSEHEQPKTWSNHQASINGTWLIRNDRIVAENVRASTDFATLVVDADFLSDLTIAGASNNPVRWLESVRGIGNAEVDLVAMQQALPGLIPVRDDVTLESGKITARVNTSSGNREGRHLSRLTVESNPIQGRTGTERVRVDPVTLTAVVSATGGDQIRADEFTFRSGFGTASGSGQLTGGDVTFDFDLGQLATMLQPLFDLGAKPPTGTANGQIRWAAESADQWHLAGELETDHLSLLSQLPRVAAKFDATGILRGTELARLDSARIDVEAKGLAGFAELIEPINRPSTDVAMPVRYQIETNGSTISRLLAASMPDSLDRIEGEILLSGNALASASQATIGDAKLICARPLIQGDFGTLAQKRLELDFQGNVQLPEANGVIDHFTLTGEAISLAAAGSFDEQSLKLDMNVRAKLDRLQSAMAERVATEPTPIFRHAGTQPPRPQNASWQYAGDVMGNISIRRTSTGNSTANPWQIATNLSGTEVRLTDPSLEIANQTVWYEPTAVVEIAARWDQVDSVLTADRFDFQTQWMLARLGGDLRYHDGIVDTQLKGQSVLEMDQVSIRVSELAGISIEADGRVERPISLRHVIESDGSTKFDVDATLGWERAEVAGLVLGPADLPIHVNETSVVVQRAAIPVGDGRLSPAGTLYYAGPNAVQSMWVQVEPGKLAESVDLTPEMTAQWMKYMAPIAASAANARGTIGMQIDEATVWLDAPGNSTVRGSLVIGGATMTAGPMIQRLMEGIERARALVRTIGGKETGELKDRAGATLVTMPPQEVDFSLDQSVVHHERMFFQVDRAEIFTSGRVTADGQVDMVAQLPLDARWLGGDLSGMAGRSVTLPIRGNLASPKVDSSAIAGLATDTAVEVGKREVDRFLEKQLNRGFEKLFGK